MQILNLGSPIKIASGSNINTIKFNSLTNFIDADLIFWDVSSVVKDVPGYINKVNEDIKLDRFKPFIDKVKERKKQFQEFFDLGRTLILTSPIFDVYKFKIDDIEYVLDFIDCLEIKKPQIESTKGSNIQTIDNSQVKNFLILNKNLFHYDFHITKSSGIPLMYIKQTQYILSEFYKVRNGLIIVLPSFRSGLENTDNKTFVNSINDLIKELKNIRNTVPNEIAEWVDNYSLIGEDLEIKRLHDLKIEESKIKAKIAETNNKLKQFKFLKALFGSDGHTLEKAVKYIFENIGFDVEVPTNNRDDLILKHENKIAVIEIKGLSKSAGEKNSVQLQKWVTNYHLDNDYNPKGLLIINTFKNLKIEDRNDSSFPDQMMDYVNKMEHCLITGLQLLCIYLDFTTNKISKSEIADLLFNTIGELEYKENFKKLILKK